MHFKAIIHACLHMDELDQAKAILLLGIKMIQE